MVTRIPQPQFAGPAPAEVQVQAAANATRQAELFQKGIQDAAANYINQKNAETERQKANTYQQEANTQAKNAQTESDRLKMSLLANDLQKDLTENGAMSYVDRKAEWTQLFSFLSGGDKDLARTMYEGGAAALNKMSASQMLSQGLIGTVPGGSPAIAAPTPQPTNPALPPNPAMTSQPQMPFPSGTAANPSPGMAPAAPAPSAAPGAAFQRLPDAVEGKQGIALAPTGPSTSVSITEMTKGLANNAVTQAANAGLSKIAGIAMGNVDPSTAVTPKENRAIDQAVKPTIQVLKNGRTQAFLDAGGTQEALQRGADQLNEAMQNPQFAEFIKTANIFNDQDTKAYDTFVANDDRLQAALARVQAQDRATNQRNMAVATQAFGDQLKYATAVQRLQIEAANGKNKKAQEELNAYNAALAAVKNYDAVADKVRDQYLKDHKGAGDEEINDYLNREMIRPNSGLSSALSVAAKLWGNALGYDDIPTAEIQLKAQYFAGIPFLPETRPAQSGTVPQIANPQTSPGAQPSAKPRTGGSPAQPTAQQKQSSVDDLINQAMK